MCTESAESTLSGRKQSTNQGQLHARNAQLSLALLGPEKTNLAQRFLKSVKPRCGSQFTVRVNVVVAVVLAESFPVPVIMIV